MTLTTSGEMGDANADAGVWNVSFFARQQYVVIVRIHNLHRWIDSMVGVVNAPQGQ